MLTKINSEHIQKAVEIAAKAQHYTHFRAYRIPELIIFQDDVTKFLLAFCVKQCESNPRWWITDVSKYYLVNPQEENQVTFLDFLRVLKRYEYKKLRVKNEAYFIKFLKKCDRFHFEFYLSLFGKSFTKGIKLAALYECLDVDSIDLERIYDLEALTQKFEELTYPLAVTTLDTLDAQFMIHSVTPTSYSDRTFKLTSNPKLTNCKIKTNITEKVFSKRIEFTLCGYRYEERQEFEAVKDGVHVQKVNKEVTKFVPIDFFDSYADYLEYFRGHAVENVYSARVEKLNEFLVDSPLGVPYVGFVEGPEDLPDEITKVMLGKEVSHILLSDANSAKTGITKYVRCKVAESILEDYWVSPEGEIKGFLSWFNGKPREVRFNFSGDSQRLLYGFSPLKYKVLKMLVIDIADSRYYYGVEVMWHKKPYMTQPLESSGILVDKCALCGGKRYVADVRGTCRSCCQNMELNMKAHGYNKWIAPGYFKTKKRAESLWEPELANLVKYRYKGRLLKVRDDGWWALVDDDESMAEYKKWLEIHAGYKPKKKRRRKKK